MHPFALLCSPSVSPHGSGCRLLAEGRQGTCLGGGGPTSVWNIWQVVLSVTHCPGGCALQQGAGVQDGMAGDEGTVQLGPKRLWKVGLGEPQSRGHAFPETGAEGPAQLI